MAPETSRHRWRATLIDEPLVGLRAFPDAWHLILHSRPLLVLAVLGGILPLACGLFMAAFFWLVVEPWPRGSGPLLDVLGYLCLTLSLAAFPIWGPLSFVVQRRAFLLTFAALGGPTPPRLRESWLELGTAWLTGLVARLYLGFFATGVVLLLLFATRTLLRLLSLEAGGDFFHVRSSLQMFVSFAFAAALTYLVPQHRGERRAARATLLGVWRQLPRFVGYQAGLVLLAALFPLNFILPTLAAVAGALFHIDSAESESRVAG